jgi:hypothetical protein
MPVGGSTSRTLPAYVQRATVSPGLRVSVSILRLFLASPILSCERIDPLVSTR